MRRMPRQQRPHGGDQLARDRHHGLVVPPERGFVLRDRLVFGLVLVVLEQALDALLVPAGGILITLHFLKFPPKTSTPRTSSPRRRCPSGGYSRAGRSRNCTQSRQT